MATAPPLPRSFEEASRFSSEVEAELDRVCASAQFHSSKRSCEFLRYVVRVTLDGRIDSLKERTIGIDLLGRDTTYEPSSDATVRVRANEVRKRLASYYGSHLLPGTLRIDLPVGCYVPRFPLVENLPLQPLTSLPRPAFALPGSHAPELVKTCEQSQPAIEPLSALVRMKPAMLALLACVLLLRQQLDSREDYLRFWDHFLSGRTSVQLSLNDADSFATALYPLLWIAGRYGVEATVGAASVTAESSAHVATVHVARTSLPGWRSQKGLEWQLNAMQEHTALLTLLPDEPDTLYLQASDDIALRRLCEELTSSRRFPSGLWQRASANGAVQLLVHQDASGRWDDELWPQTP